MRAMGINWNSLDPFPRYGPTDFPVFTTPPIVDPAFAYPVLTETPVVTTAPAAATGIPTWALIGGSVLAGAAVAALLLK